MLIRRHSSKIALNRIRDQCLFQFALCEDRYKNLDYRDVPLLANYQIQSIMIKQTSIVDVRTSGEFSGGHVAGSVNIPLDEVVSRVEEIKSMPKPLIICCASGARSGQAAAYLNTNGIECENGGSRMDVNGTYGNK